MSKTDEREKEEVRQPAPKKAAPKKAAEKKNDFSDHKLVEDLGKEMNVPDWELAALKTWMKWAEGKRVTSDEFGKTLGSFRMRRQGD